MAKQLSLYETLQTGASRDIWRKNSITYRSTYKIPFKIIVILPEWNTRTVFEGIEELAEDILVNGLHEPLEGVMSPDGKKFFLTDGERRYKAIQLLRSRKVLYDDVEVVPVPRTMKPQDMLVKMLSSGIQKSMYKDVEVANGLFRLKNDFKFSNEEIGKKMGRSRQWVDNMIKLAKQPDEVKQEVATGAKKKTQVVVPMKDKTTDVTAGLTKNKPLPGLPASLKTDNKKAESELSEAAGKVNQGNNGLARPVVVSGTDALQGVNFDKEINEQEGQINIIAKEVNKIEGLGKGLNDQAQDDLKKYLFVIRDNITKLKEYYSKFKNRVVK